MLPTRTCYTLIHCIGLVFVALAPLYADSRYTPPIEVRSEDELPQVRTGIRFQKSLDSIVPGAAWKEVPLRDILRQLSELYQVAIVSDRRLDPTLVPEIAITGRSLWDVIGELGHQVAAEPLVVGNCIFMGTKERTPLLRTLTELRKSELLSRDDEWLHERWVALQRPRSVQWGDLTPPLEMIERVAARFSLQVANTELLPHDLCAGGGFYEMTAAEMLTVILIQYDLTFRWSDNLEMIFLEALPSDPGEIVIERSIVATGSIRSRVKRHPNPAVQFRFEGTRLVVKGHVEEVEAFLAAVRDNRLRSETPNRSDGRIPLEQREFTLSVTGVPINAILENLEGSGIAFDYDPESFRNARIDLQTPVSVDLKQASAQEFFTAVFQPLNVDFVLDGTNVRLRLRK